MIREASICSVKITTKRAKKTWSKGKNWNFDMNLRRPVRLQLSRKQDSYLADQSTTVLRCIWECSSQILVRRATKRPLRPKIGTARRTQNIPYPGCIVTPVCPSSSTGSHSLPLPHVYFTSYIVSDVSSTPIALCGRQGKFTRNCGKRFLGNAKWRQTTQIAHNKYLMLLCMCK